VSLALVVQHEKAHASYYIIIWHVRLYHILPHYLIHGTIFDKTLLSNITDILYDVYLELVILKKISEILS